MSKRDVRNEVEGNAMASVEAVQRMMLKLAQKVLQTDGMLQRLYEGEVDVVSIKFIAPNMDKGEWMAVVSGTVNGTPVVAFHGGTEFHECLEGVLNRLQNGSMAWKADKYRT